jgi:ribonuclease R
MKSRTDTKKKRAPLKKSTFHTLQGTLRMHQRGFGFVIPDDPSHYSKDIFIPKQMTGQAVDGDRVEVEINPDSNWEKGPDGRVITILQRGRTHLAGTVLSVDTLGEAIVYVPLLGSSKRLVVQKASLQVGDRIIAKIVDWGEGAQDPILGQLSRRLGHISDPSVDVSAAIEEFNLRSEFSKEILKEAKAIGSKVLKKDQKGRENLTALGCITIDPDTAKDFDDALSLTKDQKGGYHLGVHIADVAHYVPPLSALDIEAQQRCNSTYFPGVCVPMLPEALSNQLCSLRPDVIRLTVSVLMDFDQEGTLLDCRIVRAYIKSQKRFTYKEAKRLIDGKGRDAHTKSLKLMVELCKLLKQKRSERGSIDFSLPEFVIQVDTKGVPIGIECVEYDISHQLVEEFMLKANEVVAKYLIDRKRTPLYRIHEEPTAESQEDFFTLARSLGFQLPAKPTHQDLQKLFEEAKKSPFGQQLSIGFIRSMRLAYYSPDNVGHYGLALEHYCHFTSPIRRYSDLITQRLLFFDSKSALPPETLDKMASKCSEQERISFKAESHVKLLKKLRLLDHYLEENPTRNYEAFITRIKPFGVQFELSSLMLEGFLHISELEDDYFVYFPERSLLRGRRSGKTHTIGEKIEVFLVSVDLILLESKWRLVSSRKRRR